LRICDKNMDQNEDEGYSPYVTGDWSRCYFACSHDWLVYIIVYIGNATHSGNLSRYAVAAPFSPDPFFAKEQQEGDGSQSGGDPLSARCYRQLVHEIMPLARRDVACNMAR
jgi:hypothetical protein